MAESTKVRLVRCPKCENLLPELADFSVYQCGGCGAVLRAKEKRRQPDTLSEKSDEARDGEIAKSQNSSEKGMVDLGDVSDTDINSNGGILRPNKNCLEKNDGGFVERCQDQSKVINKCFAENNLDINLGRNELDLSVGREQGDLNPRIGHMEGSHGSGRMSDWRIGERSEEMGFQRTSRPNDQGLRFSTSKYPDEGPSNYHLHSSPGYGEFSRNHNDVDMADRVQYNEQERAQLLRKLDELKEQLGRSCDMVDKPNGKVPLDGRMLPPEPCGAGDAYLHNGSSASDRVPRPLFGPDKQAASIPFHNHYPDPLPYSTAREIAMHGLYPSMHNTNHMPAYGDTFGSRVLRGAPHQFHGQYQEPLTHPYFSRQYAEPSHDLFEPYTRNPSFHQPSCSCFHCYEKYRQVPAPFPPPVFSNKRFPDIPNNPMLYNHESGAFGPHVHNSRTATHHPLNYCGSQAHTRWPSDLKTEVGSFMHSRPRRVVLAGGGRRCLPIAGGAPFVTCYNCFELLQLPKKVHTMVPNQQKLRCGACSTVINLAIINKKLVLSVNAETKRISTEVDENYNEMVKDRISHSRGRVNWAGANFSSDDYDHSGYDFQSMDRDPLQSSSAQGLNSSKPQDMQSFHSSSPNTSEDESSPDVLVAPQEVGKLVQPPPVQPILSPPPPGSPLQEHFDFSSNNNTGNRFGKGNRSSRSDQDKVTGVKATTRQNSLKEASLATEMEVSFNEYSNTGISQDSGDAAREDIHPKPSKGGESFFANIIKKSFKDFSRSNQTEERGRSSVSINGHLIPDRLLKKAEKLAGPIHPGQYWYDFRAGFWGVIGGPCLGIVPPYIEEFNYPMPENCAGGNTGVYVNGRELHQKDFDLLASRGLPTGRDRSYIVEISGRVLDEDTGEELDSLGKLAPTVERVKHGFGMKLPRSAT